jgi:hypothetical protein
MRRWPCSGTRGKPTTPSSAASPGPRWLPGWSSPAEPSAAPPGFGRASTGATAWMLPSGPLMAAPRGPRRVGKRRPDQRRVESTLARSEHKRQQFADRSEAVVCPGPRGEGFMRKVTGSAARAPYSTRASCPINPAACLARRGLASASSMAVSDGRRLCAPDDDGAAQGRRRVEVVSGMTALTN